jgi:hypothetical protein
MKDEYDGELDFLFLIYLLRLVVQKHNADSPTLWYSTLQPPQTKCTAAYTAQ